jgi:hypothetical protein
MINVIRQLLADEVFLVVVMSGNEWTGTSLIRQDVPGDIPQLEPGELAQVVSWSGKYDRTIRAGEPE